MEYNKLTVAKLKEILDYNNYEYDAKVKKATLVDICLVNKLQGPNEVKTKKRETIKSTDDLIREMNEEAKILEGRVNSSSVDNDSKANLNSKEVQAVDKVTNQLIELARKNGNIIEDITLDHTLITLLGVNYNKVVFAKIEKNLLAKNISVDYSSEELHDEIIVLHKDDLVDQVGQEELDYSIENLLKGVNKKQDNDEVKNFLSSINDYPLLSSEKEMELAIIIAEHKAKVEADEEISYYDETVYDEAKSLLALSNKRLVVSVAKKYVNRGLDLIDLVMEGMLGLDKAIMKYDHTLGYKFSTFATWWIRQGITRAIADKSKVIRVPVHMVETINRVAKIQRELTQQLGYEPTYEQIGQAIDPPMTVEKIEHIFNIAKDPIALEMPIGDDNSSLEAFIEDDKHLSQDAESEKSELRRKLLEIIEEIPEREGEVLLFRYGLYDLDVTPLKAKLETLEDVLQLLEKDVITSMQAMEIIGNTDKIKESQRTKYVKRIAQNNTKYDRKVQDLNLIRHKKDKKSQERIIKLEKSIAQIKESNVTYLEKLIEHTREQIKILGQIDEETNGVVKALTLEDIGSLLDVTRERIRQIESKGKRKLKAFVDKERLDLYIK